MNRPSPGRGKTSARGVCRRQASSQNSVRKFPMGGKRLEELQSKDPLEVALNLNSNRSGFKELLCQRNLGGEKIINILKVLDVACSCPRKENLAEMLKMINGLPLFLDQLKEFLEGIGQPKDKKAAPLSYVTTFLEALNVASPVEFKLTIESFLPLLENILSRCDPSNSGILIRIQVLSKKCENSELNVDRPVQVESFRNMSIFPRQVDITTSPLLTANLVHGKYSNVDEYLDVQFRLFREDYIRPLRESIINYRTQWNEGTRKNFKDVRVYHNVRILKTFLTVDDGIVHMMEFKSDGGVNWDNSKRLIYGSLVCLSSNHFANMMVATVAVSEPRYLREGIVYIRFVEERAPEPHMLKNVVFTAIETDAYFEAYRHVLSALQDYESSHFPMEEYFVKVKSDTKPPVYLKDTMQYCFHGLFTKSITDFDRLLEKIVDQLSNLSASSTAKLADAQCDCLTQSTSYPASDVRSWPKESSFNLDISQLDAFKSALTQKLSLIQGPPGTGKTHVGLKIVNALLHNQLYQTSTIIRYPILIVCYTNHALDQFLEGVLKFTKNVVRVGGRSNSEVLQKYTLKNIKLTSKFDFTRSYRGQVRGILEASITQRAVIQKLINDSKGHLLSELDLVSDIPDHHMNSLLNLHPACMNLSEYARTGDFIRYWLGSKLPDHYYYGFDGKTILWLADICEEMERMLEYMTWSEELCKYLLWSSDTRNVTAVRLSPKERKLRRIVIDRDFVELADVDYIKAQRAEDGEVLTGATELFESQNIIQKQNIRTFVSDHLQCEPMSEAEFNSIRNVWALRLPNRWRLYKSWLNTFYVNSQEKIDHLKCEYERKLVLYNELRQEQERLVTQNCDVIGLTTTGAAKYKHLLRSLKPRVVIVEEAAEVLEAHVISSLGENTQHLILIGDHQQLRPNPSCYELAKHYGLDISLFERLIKNGLPFYRLGIQHRMRPCIADLLVPHIYESLENHSSVLEYEDVLGVEKNMFFLNHSVAEQLSDSSKYNTHEATYMLALCRYLLLQGYRPDQITILTTYLAQFALMKKLCVLQGVKIAVVDNYQGEECDIILLSLVRSNRHGSIGFLKIDNRVCVALSRAKKGLYCIGNFDLLFEECSLWKNIVAKIKTHGAIGPNINVKCQNHGTVTATSKENDFDELPDGGCSLPCDFELKCGHICLRLCHPLDREHKVYKCRLPCQKRNETCQFKHPCTRKCYEDCGLCLFQVKKRLEPCLHEVFLPCHRDPKLAECSKPCPEIKACGHKCPLLCRDSCSVCNVIVTVRSPCEHLVSVPCFKSGDDKSLLSACKEPCQKVLVCEHLCKGTCGSACTTFCLQLVEQALDCGHKMEVPCHSQNTDSRKCPTLCKAVLECGHHCTGTCGKCVHGKLHIPCIERCKKALICGHFINKAVCSQAYIFCKDKCRYKCSHRQCPLICGSPCQPCREPCTWKCEHYACSRKCGELCDRPVCDKPCSKQLNCGHNCLGLCGEVCPPKCKVCNSAVTLVTSRLQVDVEDFPELQGKLILLESCGHVFELLQLQAWLKTETVRGNFSKIQVPSCPNCKAPICGTGRLGKISISSHDTLEQLKRKLHGSASDCQSKLTILRNRLSDLQVSTGRRGRNNTLCFQESPRTKLDQITKRAQDLHSVLLANVSAPGNRLPLNVEVSTDNFVRILEDLTLLLPNFQTAQGAPFQFFTKTVDNMIAAALACARNASYQCMLDLSLEMKKLHIIASKLNAQGEIRMAERGGIKIDDADLSKACAIAQFREFADFSAGNWYICRHGHPCYFLHFKGKFSCCPDGCSNS